MADTNKASKKEKKKKDSTSSQKKPSPKKTAEKKKPSDTASVLDSAKTCCAKEKTTKEKASKKEEDANEKLPTTEEATAKIEEYKNEKVEVVVERKENCIVELTVKANSLLLAKGREQAYKSVRKEVEIPGFRKGKAPKQIIEKKFQDAIVNRTQSESANIALAEAMQLTQIPRLNQDTKVSYTPKNFAKDDALFLFRYETTPNIPVIDPTTYPIGDKTAQTIGEKERKEAMKQMRLFYAKWIPITDRGVEEKDFIIVDLKTLAPVEEVVFSDTRFEVSDSHMAKWMKKLVLGKRCGEQVEGESEPDDTASEEDKKTFDKKRVLLTIKKIEIAQLPPLDDDFAKKAGAANLQKLEEYLENMLQQKVEEQFLQEQRESVNRFLLDNYPFSMPFSLVEAEKNHRKQQMLQDNAQSKHWSGLSADEKQSLEKTLWQQAEEAVCLFYLSRDIVRRNNLSVTEEEVKQEAQKTLQTFGPAHIDMNKIPREVFALALSKVILGKAQRFILDNARNSKLASS